MGWQVRIKSVALAAVSACVEGALEMLPGRIRAIVADRAPMVRPLDYRRHRILLHVDSELEYRVRLRSAGKEPETVRWIEQHFRAGDVFYDIGANVGAYSLIAATCVPNLRVCAFEPSALNFGQLVRNVALNGCGDRIMPLALALGDATRMEVFHYQNLTRGGALHTIGDPLTEQGRAFVPALSQKVRIESLDDVVRQYDLPPPSHIKIDVDGAEPRILTGAAATLMAPTLRTVLLETTDQGGPPAGITAALRPAGLKLIATHQQPGGYANFLFARDTGI
ncbi:MAG TPA: FkbM family methyltransferase [Vicinamibacterales bacterium]|nr:FkbM family methyltransferase [Vicinamibacterales bacterium]